MNRTETGFVIDWYLKVSKLEKLIGFGWGHCLIVFLVLSSAFAFLFLIIGCVDLYFGLPFQLFPSDSLTGNLILGIGYLMLVYSIIVISYAGVERVRSTAGG